MKTLTLWQPWASLLACGAKKFETRGWATQYRGPIAIHAAMLNPFKAIRPIPEDAVWEMRQALKKAGILNNTSDFRALPRGAVIATGELVGCHNIVSVGWTGYTERRIAWVDEKMMPHYPSEDELLFGDWTPGRFAWEIKNVKMLPDPIPAKGKQGLWNWEGIG